MENFVRSFFEYEVVGVFVAWLYRSGSCLWRGYTIVDRVCSVVIP